jgi:parvulin-like peptidyl-prolyl isomerase
MVEDRFGPGFAASVFACDTGTWSGPFASAYGVHLIFVRQSSAERIPDFAEVADRIATDLDTERRSGALDRIYAGVRDAYEVDIEPAAPEGASRPDHSHSHDVHIHEERTRA